eukprot:NODE_654_length_5502_cov_0.204516.p6 type:complete len:116 gc:universal NODE_654_length_5502_cov_0.204516:3072-2725(-)
MFVALLLVAFPITILSINMSDLYSNYRTEKVVEMEEQDFLKLNDKAMNMSKLTKEQLIMLKEMSLDLVKSMENLTILQESTKCILDQNDSIRQSVKAMMGSFSLPADKIKSVVIV